MSSLGEMGVSNANSIGTTILNRTMDDTSQRTPIKDFLSESDEEEYDPFNSLSTCISDGRTIPFVSHMINEMVPMNNNE